MPFPVHPFSDMPAVSSWPIRASIPARCNTTLGTRTSSTPCDIPSFPQTGFGIFGTIRYPGRAYRLSTLAFLLALRHSKVILDGLGQRRVS